MKLLPYIALIAGLLLFAAACAPLRSPAAQTSGAASSPSATWSAAASAAAGKVRAVSPAEAKKRLDAGETIVLLDVRTPEEYAEGHIAGSLLLPLDSIDSKASEMLKDKGAVIFVYCRSGRRSKLAAEQLMNMGYTQVFDLGGIIDWPYGTTLD